MAFNYNNHFAKDTLKGLFHFFKKIFYGAIFYWTSFKRIGFGRFVFERIFLKITAEGYFSDHYGENPN